MMTATSSAAKGLQRKTLADQLDRLDQILDGLGEALTAAVAQAVTEGVAAAVTQLIRRPDLCRPAENGHSADVQPTWRDRMRRACGRAAARMCEMSARAGRLVRRAWVRATTKSHRQRVAKAMCVTWEVLTEAAVRAGARLAAACPQTWRWPLPPGRSRVGLGRRCRRLLWGPAYRSGGVRRHGHGPHDRRNGSLESKDGGLGGLGCGAA
jgi:hypothetical protein